MSVKWRIVWQALYQFERREILRHEAEQRLLSAGLTIGEINERMNEILITGHYTMRREEPALQLLPTARATP